MTEQVQCPSRPLFVHVTLSWLATLSVADLRKAVYMHNGDRAVVIRIGSLSGRVGAFMLYDHRAFSVTTVRMSCHDLEWQRSVLVALGQPALATWKQTQHGIVIQLNFPGETLAQYSVPAICPSVYWLPKGAVQHNEALWHWSTLGSGVIPSEFRLFLTDDQHTVIGRGQEYSFEASDRVRPVWKADKRRRKHVVPGPAFQKSKSESVALVPIVETTPVVPLSNDLPNSRSSTPELASCIALERVLPSVEALLPWRPEQPAD